MPSFKTLLLLLLLPDIYNPYIYKIYTHTSLFKLVASSSTCRGGSTLSSVNNIPPSRFRPRPPSSSNIAKSPNLRLTSNNSPNDDGCDSSSFLHRFPHLRRCLIVSHSPPFAAIVVVPHRVVLRSRKNEPVDCTYTHAQLTKIQIRVSMSM